MRERERERERETERFGKITTTWASRDLDSRRVEFQVGQALKNTPHQPRPH